MDLPVKHAVEAPTQGNREPCILLTSYGTGAGVGKKLGVAGYSHDIVAKIYRPLLEKIGKVVLVDDPRGELIPLAEAARRDGLFPLQFSITPFQDAFLPQSLPSVIAPAWEFPDVPDHEFGGNPQNNWPATANRCTRVVVSGKFTADALQRRGTTVPIDIVQVPVADSLFDIPTWSPEQTVEMHCRHIELRHQEPERAVVQLPSADDSPKRRQINLRSAVLPMARGIYRYAVRPVLGNRFARSLRDALRVGRHTWRSQKLVSGQQLKASTLRLSGIVYTSIFNPNDGRKNWHDLLTGFLVAMADRPDVTLVIKLVTSDPVSVGQFMLWYRQRMISHQCRVVLVTGFLPDEQMQDLIRATTYYIQTTKAEGNCLPLMDSLAAGRPGISPNHSAMSDYFDQRFGHVIQSSPEPAAWPHDPRGGIQTTWARIDWSSVVTALQESYRQVTSHWADYQAMSERAREHMSAWASCSSIQPRLEQVIRQAIESAEDGSAADGNVHDKIAA